MENIRSQWEAGAYASQYKEVEGFALKMELDNELASEVDQIVTSREIENPVVIEFGCGPAPISNLLLQNSEKKYQCVGLDFSDDMGIKKTQILHNPSFQFRKCDLTVLSGQPELQKFEKKADVITMENMFYAVTVPNESGLRYTEDEAHLNQANVIKNAAYMLKEGGYIVLTDPASTATELGLKGVLDFITSEIKTTINYEKRQGLIDKAKSIKGTLERLVTPEVKSVLDANKDLTSRARLVRNKEELIKKVEEGGFFEVIEAKEGMYLGHNIGILARRTNQELVASDPGFNGTYLIRTGLPGMAKQVDGIRQEMYAEAGVNPHLESALEDKYDQAKDSVAVVVAGKHGRHPIVVVSLHIFDKDKNVPLEMEEIMKAQDSTGTFKEQLLKAIDPNLVPDDIGIGELRRFASIIPQDRNGIKGLQEGFARLVDKLLPYCHAKKVDFEFIIADKKRVKFFNLALRDKDLQFKTLDGFELDRESLANQTLFLSSERYFLEQPDNYLEEEEVLIFKEFQRILIDNPGKVWTDLLKESSSPGKTEKIMKKALDVVPDGLVVAYLDTRNK